MKPTALLLAATLLLPRLVGADVAVPDDRIVVGPDDDGRSSIEHARFSRSGEALPGRV